jgi:hypothetical protein
MIWFPPELKKAAERAVGCDVRFLELHIVVETFQGKVIWEGGVHEFESDKGKVYVWSFEGDDEPQYAAVLHRPPIDSPIAAVRAWIASMAK